MKLRIELDNETVDRLIALAIRERRSIRAQAEVLLREALAREGERDGDNDAQ